MTFEEFGQDLRAQRVARNVSLADIAADTRINQRFLEAIERGQFSVLPQTYIRAFLREYASAVGIPAEEVLQRYGDAGRPASAQSSVKADSASRTAASSVRTSPLSGPMALPAAWRPFVVGGVLLAIGLLAVFLLVDMGSKATPTTTTWGTFPYSILFNTFVFTW